ncbi:hypothetical protein JST97_07875 [bacterium]|nr:hypothetical protein [bacterium]
MKKYLLLIALSPLALAEPTGFSPTLPFGIPAHSTQAPVNNSGPAHVPYNYNGGYGYYYYYGAGGGGMATGTYHSSSYGSTLPSYQSSNPQKGLDSYNNSSKRKNDTLPGY